MDESSTDRMLTARQAGRILGVGRDTIKRYPIPYHQVGPRGHRRYREADILAWLERTRVEAIAG